MPEKLAMSADQAAEALGVSRSEIYKLARTNDFPAIHVGKRVLVSINGLKEWINKGGSKND